MAEQEVPDKVKQSSSNPVAKCFSVTLNNYTEDDIEAIQAIDGVSRMVLGREVGESGTPHIQGFILFQRAKRWNAVREMPEFERAHIEVTRVQAALEKYCKKDGDYIVIDNRKERRKLQCLADACTAILDRRSLGEVAREYPSVFVRYHRGLERLASELDAPPRRVPSVIWYYGRTGVGKSRCAESLAEALGDAFGWTAYWKSGGYRWWQGYRGQDIVVLDELRGDFCTLHQLLRLLDRYPLYVENKGGSWHISASCYIITAPFAPPGLYPGKSAGSEDLAQLFRRISRVVRVDEGGVEEDMTEVWHCGKFVR